LNTCRVLACGEGGNPELRLQAVDAGLQVARAFAVLGRGEKAKQAAAAAVEWGRRLVHESPDAWLWRFRLAGGHRQYGLLLRELGETGAAAEQFQLALDAWNDPNPLSPCPLEASESHANLGDL